MKARSSDGERRGPLFTLVDIAGEDDIDALDLGANPTPPTVSRTSIGRPILRRRGSRTTAGDTSQQQTHNCYCPIRIRTRERWQMRGQTSPFEYVTVSTIGAGSASTIVEKSCDGTPKN